MSEELKIDFQWLGGRSGNTLDNAFFADLGLAVGDDWLTRLEDLEAKTVYNHVRACAYQLGIWFAANWWRLRWEPKPANWTKDVDWRTSHCVASAGQGYIWPNVVFASDGESLEITSRASKAVPFEPIRYLNSFTGHITAGDFERKVDAFIDHVIARGQAMGIGDNTLSNLWMEVLEERADPEASRRRRLEAVCGYDPDDAPDGLIGYLLADHDRLGAHAVEEVAAYARQDTSALLKKIEPLAAQKTSPGRAGMRGTLPERSPRWRNTNQSERPWERALHIARQARRKWGFNSEPITNHRLAEIMGTSPASLERDGEVRTQIPVAFRRGDNKHFDLFFQSRRATGRRFAAARLLGDHCSFAPVEKLVPETEARTARQQFQRSFAQEFLCPINALRASIPTDQPGEADFEQAAEHFQVSSLLVKSALVNHGYLDREVLEYAA